MSAIVKIESEVESAADVEDSHPLRMCEDGECGHVSQFGRVCRRPDKHRGMHSNMRPYEAESVLGWWWT